MVFYVQPMTSQELWGHVRSHYGTDLGCSSDEDYVGPGLRFLFRFLAFVCMLTFSQLFLSVLGSPFIYTGCP